MRPIRNPRSATGLAQRSLIHPTPPTPPVIIPLVKNVEDDVLERVNVERHVGPKDAPQVEHDAARHGQAGRCACVVPVRHSQCARDPSAPRRMPTMRASGWRQVPIVLLALKAILARAVGRHARELAGEVVLCMSMHRTRQKTA